MSIVLPFLGTGETQEDTNAVRKTEEASARLKMKVKKATKKAEETLRQYDGIWSGPFKDP